MALTTVWVSHDQLTADPTRWRESASCTSVGDYFFFAPESETDHARYLREGIARGICEGCAARNHCCRYSLETAQPYGVWGGLTERERKEILRDPAHRDDGNGPLDGPWSSYKEPND